MSIEGVAQPEELIVDKRIRLREYDGIFDFALPWYQDEEMVYLVDGVKRKYDLEKIKCMYEYLNKMGELYFIEIKEDGKFIPIGDVTFSKDDLQIVIGDKTYKGRGIGKKVIRKLVERARLLGYEEIKVEEIYDFNIGSQKCFEQVGFLKYEKTRMGNRYIKSIN